MAEEQVNPFEVQPPARPGWGGMPTITPQEGQEPYAGGSHFELTPEAMQMMWAPPGQTGLVPQQQPLPPPQINPLV